MEGLESLQEQWLCNGLCSGRVCESQTGTVGGEGTKNNTIGLPIDYMWEWCTGKCTVVPQL